VVNLPAQPGQDLRLLIETWSSAGLLSLTWVSVFPQNGHRMLKTSDLSQSAVYRHH